MAKPSREERVALITRIREVARLAGVKPWDLTRTEFLDAAEMTSAELRRFGAWRGVAHIASQTPPHEEDGCRMRARNRDLMLQNEALRERVLELESELRSRVDDADTYSAVVSESGYLQ